MRMHELGGVILLVIFLLVGAAAPAQTASEEPRTDERPLHEESAQQHEGDPPPAVETPPLPQGMTLDEVLDRAASPPPQEYPDPVPDDQSYLFTMFDQLEYRAALDESRGPLGWEAQGWFGGDFQKFWWKNEGEAVFEGEDEGESETDLLYSRLISPFWNAQVGVQYANGWTSDSYEDRWSGVIALQGLVPYKFELDNSVYVSEEGDFTVEIEAEYDLRITQRLVLQPRWGLSFAFQDIPERSLGAGMTSADLDLRLRYEFRRELAPYVGIRYGFLVGETDEIAETMGRDTSQTYLLGGLRLAF